MRKPWVEVEAVETDLRDWAQERSQGLAMAELRVLCDRLAIARQRAREEVQT